MTLSLQVQLGWKATETPVLTTTLPTVTQWFPSAHVGLLYSTLSVKRTRLRRLLQFLDLGMRSSPVSPDAISPGPDSTVTVSVPPKSEPILSMLPGVRLSGVQGVLALTNFRVIFVPVFAFILVSLFAAAGTHDHHCFRMPLCVNRLAR